MSNTPFFSIILPTYNRATFLPQAIGSVRDQSYVGWELIVIDDASTDNTLEVVQSFNDSRIHYIKNEKNIERSASRNKGIERAKGQYVCFLDSDDVFLPERLHLLHAEIEKRSCPEALFFTDLVYNNGIVLSYSDEMIKAYKTVFDFLAAHIIGVPQVCIHRGIVKYFRFNPTYHIAEDLDLWLRIAKKHPLIYLERQKTVKASMHENRSVNERKYNSGKAQLLVLQDVFKPQHSGRFISRIIKKRRLGDTYFSMARHYMYKKKFFKALRNILCSLSLLPFHRQSLHKLYVIAHLVIGKIPKEYR